jgi:hypothetical protein
LRWHQCSLFALFWQILQHFIPEVMEDFNDFLKKTNIRRMDANGAMAEDGILGTYELDLEGMKFVFHLVELPSPTGFFAENYSRYVVHCSFRLFLW